MWFINGKTQHGYLLGKMSYVCDRFLEMRHLRAYLDPSLHEKQYGHQSRIRLQALKSFSLQLNAGVQNILNSFQTDFDSGADRDSGYMYGPTLPRAFFFDVKLVY